MATDTSYAIAVRSVKSSRKQQIRDLFNRVGPTSTRALVELCFDEGIYTDADAATAKVRAYQGEIREALSVSDDAGMPQAGQSTERDEDNHPLWKQRGIWEFDDYELNVRTLVVQRDTGHVQAVRLAAECERRFGLPIVISELPAA